MATAKSFNQTWGFDPTAEDFAAKTGNTLDEGVFGRAMRRTWKAVDQDANVGGSRPPSTGIRKDMPAEITAAAPGSAASATGKEDAILKQYTWVTSDGAEVGEHVSPSARRSKRNMDTAGRSGPLEGTWTKDEFKDKTADLWKRINPGTMKQYLNLPATTHRDHFQDHGVDSEKNWEQHMKKTDFSDYTEARARFGAMDKVAGGAGGGDKSTVTFRVPGKTAELFDNFPDPGSGDPNVNQRAALISYGTQARFWDGVLGKKTY